MKFNSASRQLQFLLVTLSAALAFLPVVGAHQQGGRLLTAQDIKQLPATAKRYALVIGVDEYQDTQISRLSGAANDAKALADALVRYAGFPRDQVILLASDQPHERQPNRGNILRRLSNLRGIVPTDGLLLLSFAGHGIERSGRGFLCTTDAQLNGDLALLEDTAISVETIHERIRQMGVKQVLIILDACRNDPSGRGEGENRLTDSFARKFNFDVRNQEVTAFATLYATDVGHVTYEYKEKRQGYFSYLMVEGLRGGAANERGEVTLGSLVRYLQEQVPKQVGRDLGQEKSQRPYATVGGYKADDLIISIAAWATPDRPAVQTADAATIELAFWNTIQNSNDPDDFREYLAKYSKGWFAGLAKNKIRSLEAAAKSPVMNPRTTDPTGPSGGASDSTQLIIDRAEEAFKRGEEAQGKGFPDIARKLFDEARDTVLGSGVDLKTHAKLNAYYRHLDDRILKSELQTVEPSPVNERLNIKATDPMKIPPTGRQENVALQTYTEPAGGAGIEMVRVPAGKFMMGSPNGEGDIDEHPQHEVSVSSFYMSKYEVTQAQWRAVGRLPKVKIELNLYPSNFRGDNLPVERVSWEEAIEFCERWSRATGKTYRLPTEAEWEYAARGMTTGSYAGDLDEMGWYAGNSEGKAHPVGMKQANRFGLYDMQGNVSEWCKDWYGENYYAQSPSADPMGPSTVSGHVLRGGGWNSDARFCRTAGRNGWGPGYRFDGLGFRLVRTYN